MIVRVWVWEKYDRSIYRWIWAWVLLFWLMWLSLREKDRRWVILLVAVVTAYSWYEWKTQHDEEIATVKDWFLQIEWKTYYWNDLKWFSLDYSSNSITLEHTPKTLFLYTHKNVEIFTFKDTHEHVVLFSQILEHHIPYVKEIHLDWIKRVQRFLKI